MELELHHSPLLRRRNGPDLRELVEAGIMHRLIGIEPRNNLQALLLSDPVQDFNDILELLDLLGPGGQVYTDHQEIIVAEHIGRVIVEVEQLAVLLVEGFVGFEMHTPLPVEDHRGLVRDRRVTHRRVRLPAEIAGLLDEENVELLAVDVLADLLDLLVQVEE
jgi:hypothetical protein